MSILQNSNAISAGGYDVNNSVRLRSSASAYLSRTPASAGNRTVWTWSGWVKLGVFANNPFFAADSSGTAYEYFRVNGSGNIQWGIYTSGTIGSFTTNAVYRDPSAWYHVVIARNGTTNTCYVNGVQQTFSANTTTSSNGYINATNRHTLGANIQDAQYYDGYMAEINFIDGQALTPSSFGETDTTTGVWKPKAYTGTYGTNGFYLKFSDIATTSGSNAGLGKDFSGNSNYWTTNNISVTAGTTYDAMTDSPTLTSATVANYCVLNPISTLTTATLSNANLAFTTATTGHNAIGSVGMSSGKYYWEAETSAGTTQARATVYSTAASTYYSFAANNTVYGFRFDADAGTLDYTTNGTSFTSLATGLTSGPYFPYFNNNGTTSKTISVNFGQRPFTYTPPTGYVALNTYNLPDSTIKKGNSYMDATLYTGNGSTLAVTNSGSMKPDFVWIKSRSSGALWHALFDSVRGVNKRLFSNSTDAEDSTANTLTSFDSNGFTLGSQAGQNTNGATFVGWLWQAGQGTTSSNTQGSITSTVSVNSSAGFSIVTYTGTGANATVGHGLGVAPKIVIVKPRSFAERWGVYHASLGAGFYLDLSSTQAATATTSYWNSTNPTSTVFSLGNGAAGNTNGATYVGYCWAEIAGFSKFGSYTGNGSADGTFVYLGFRPKFLLMKDTTLASDWYVYDTARDTYNAAPDTLNPNLSAVESGGRPIDVLSNGFKLRVGSGTNPNISGSTYIYAAFAENPFKNSLAR